MSTTPILEIKNIAKTIKPDVFKPRIKLLQGLSLSFPAGACTALMGHNGAGKTTTIRTILGLITPDKGQVLFKGAPIARQDYQRIGYMPEVNKLPANLNALEILSYHLIAYDPQVLKTRKARELVEERLRAVGLWEHRHKKTRTLSKGMARKLAWVMATIHEPELVILDEPFSGLDPRGRFEMGHWVKDLKQQGTSIIMCTHEFWSVQNVCDAIHVIRQGELIFSTLQQPETMRDIEQQAYQLEMVGLDSSQLPHFHQQEQLPAFQAVDTQGYKMRLTFSQYGDALQWFTSATRHGLVITQFQSSTILNEAELAKYF